MQVLCLMLSVTYYAQNYATSIHYHEKQNKILGDWILENQPKCYS